MITFQEEKFADIWDEFRHLAEAHWEETMRPVTNEEFNPDVNRYVQFNSTGFYRLYTARKDGKLVGDMGIYITPSMHTQTLVAQEDSWYMVPEARNGRTALRFVEFVHGELKKLGVKSGRTTTPPLAGSRRLLESVGYRHIANCYLKDF